MINLSDVYLVYAHSPKNGSPDFNRKLLGKFLIHDGQLSILSDYHHQLGMLPEGKIDDRNEELIRRFMDSPYLDVVSKGDILSGKRIDLIPESEHAEVSAPGQDEQESAPRPDSVFEYFQQGMDKPHSLEVHDSEGYLDGNKLTRQELEALMSNVESGKASLRYKKEAPSPMEKFEQAFLHLAKGEDLASALEFMRKEVAAGRFDKDHYDTVRRELFQDDMIPSIGNKKAFRDFAIKSGRGGVHIMLDANNFKSINDQLGHESGDKAIQSMGQALRTAMDTTVGSDKGKVFRDGGDEFRVYVPDHDSAAAFLRALRGHLESIPPMGGTHKLSMSAGVGKNPAHAEAAMNHAKEAKNQDLKAAGGDPGDRGGMLHVGAKALYSHSLYPGHEGASPQDLPLLPSVPPAPTQSS